MAPQITSLTIVYSTVYSGADQRKHQSSSSLAFVLGIHRWLMNYPHKWPVTRKMFPFDDVIMTRFYTWCTIQTTLVHINQRFSWNTTSYVAGAGPAFAERRYGWGIWFWRSQLWPSWPATLCNDVYHWLGANLESALYFHICLTITFVTTSSAVFFFFFFFFRNFMTDLQHRYGAVQKLSSSTKYTADSWLWTPIQRIFDLEKTFCGACQG